MLKTQTKDTEEEMYPVLSFITESFMPKRFSDVFLRLMPS